MINLFKKYPVLCVGLLETIILIFFILTKDFENYLIAAKFTWCLVLIIWVVWFQDKYYKLWYFILYALCVRIIDHVSGFLLLKIFRFFINNHFNYFFMAFCLFITMSIQSIIGQFIYDVFRKMSYEKYKNIEAE